MNTHRPDGSDAAAADIHHKAAFAEARAGATKCPAAQSLFRRHGIRL
jgi:hypothetical protein